MIDKDSSLSESHNPNWIKIVRNYSQPNANKSWWQLISNLILYAFSWFLMVQSLSYPWWLTALISLSSAGILVRIFIIFHDCGHGSFFKSSQLRDIVGHITGILTFTPYYSWTYQHKVHHATVGNLDKRGMGDVWTMTVDEYLKSSKSDQLKYRMYRHPIVMFGIGTLFVFLFSNRFTKKFMDKKMRMSVYITNTGILVFGSLMTLLIGFEPFIILQLIVIYLAAIMGFWLFYVQHQFESTFWTRTENWDYKTLALKGSSWYDLPKILHWFTGNIGYHHIHHLSPMIPNYNLAKCLHENEMFREIKPLTFLASFKSLKFRLWDEDKMQIISFKDLKKNQ
jgi:omega-6 fatty acid desaturase (delta-12 desaturase)